MEIYFVFLVNLSESGAIKVPLLNALTSFFAIFCNSILFMNDIINHKIIPSNNYQFKKKAPIQQKKPQTKEM
jgi:hypothetical protein